MDWQSIKRSCPAVAGQPNKIARFTQAMLVQKANELMATYCTQRMAKRPPRGCTHKLKAGQRPIVPTLRASWWQSWRKDYGLSMRYPNRRFKVPMPILMIRLERGWLNIFRVRAACLFLNGMDMEMEWQCAPSGSDL